MAADAAGNDFQQQAERINLLVNKVNSLTDDTARTIALELLQELMSLHASVLDRMLDLASQAGDSGLAVIDSYTRDPLVSGLMALYDLHPESLETRVGRALDKVRSHLQSQGRDVELLSVNEGLVKVRLSGSHAGCASTTAALTTAVEQAIYEAAPEVITVMAEVESSDPATGFVPLAALQGRSATT